MSKRIDRRTFVRSALTAGAGVLLAPSAGWSAAQKARLATEGAFAQGVASGEPATDAITLWTRLDGVTASANVGYEVARDAGFAQGRRERNGGGRRRGRLHRPPARERRLPRAGRAVLLPLQDRGRLVAGRALSHRRGRPARARRCGSPSSPARSSSRASTPPTATSPRRTSTSSSASATTSTSRPSPRRARPTRPRADDSAADGEAQTLAEYRRKYSLYHSDANLREVRRHFALVGEWDDHEVEDNYAGDLPGGAAKNRRVPFAERRANGYRAWFEHMPRRLAGAAEDLRLAAAGRRRALHPRLAPVPRRPAVQPDGRRALRSRARRRRPTTRRARCSAPSRRRG